MAYNPIRKIKDGEFSWKEEGLQTLKDLYKCTGLDFIVTKSERVLGTLETRDKLLVETGYALGTVMLGCGIVHSNDPFIYMASASCYLGGLLHHSAMGKNDKYFSRQGTATR